MATSNAAVTLVSSRRKSSAVLELRDARETFWIGCRTLNASHAVALRRRVGRSTFAA
jgi:hypothetical protein